MLPLILAAAAGFSLLRGKTRKNPGRRPHKRRRVLRKKNPEGEDPSWPSSVTLRYRDWRGWIAEEKKMRGGPRNKHQNAVQAAEQAGRAFQRAKEYARLSGGLARGREYMNPGDDYVLKNRIAHLRGLIREAPAEDKVKLREILKSEQLKLMKPRKNPVRWSAKALALHVAQGHPLTAAGRRVLGKAKGKYAVLARMALKKGDQLSRMDPWTSGLSTTATTYHRLRAKILRKNPDDATSRAMVRAAISAIYDMRSPKSFAKAKRKVPGLTQAEYAEAKANVSGKRKNPGYGAAPDGSVATPHITMIAEAMHESLAGTKSLTVSPIKAVNNGGLSFSLSGVLGGRQVDQTRTIEKNGHMLIERRNPKKRLRHQ